MSILHFAVGNTGVIYTHYLALIQLGVPLFLFQ